MLMQNERKITVDEIVYKTIKEEIISGSYKSGDRLIELEVAQRLNTSRTPVRDALKQLEREGFLVKEPYKGMMVRRFTCQEIINYYQVRSVLEALCSYLVVKKLDSELEEYFTNNIYISKQAIKSEDYKLLAQLNNDFHTKLAIASGNTMLQQLLENLRAYSSIMRISIWSIPDRPKIAVEEHEAIVGAIIKGKKILAAKRTLDHIRSSYRNAQKILSFS